MKNLLKGAALSLIFMVNIASAQTCISGAQQVTPTSRFLLQNDQAVDTKTNLIWQRCVVGQTWNSGTQNCEGTATKQKWKAALDSVPEGWRMPNIREMLSIMEHSCVRPAMNLTVFPGAISEWQWSSTPMVNAGRFSPGEQRAWGVQTWIGESTSLIKNSFFGLSYRLVKDLSPAAVNVN